MDLVLINQASAFIGSLGPMAVLLLLLLPLNEDIVIIAAGILVGKGHLPLWETFACAYAGALAGDGAWYFLCYYFGTPLLHKRWFKRLAHPRRLLQAKHQVEKRGAWLIVSARFVPGSRTSAMVAAGLLHMPMWKFLLAECSALCVTLAIQLGLGYLIAHRIGSLDLADDILAVIAVVAALTITAMVVSWIRRYRCVKQQPPRSKAAWLRRFRRPVVRPQRATETTMPAMRRTAAAARTDRAVQLPSPAARSMLISPRQQPAPK